MCSSLLGAGPVPPPDSSWSFNGGDLAPLHLGTLPPIPEEGELPPEVPPEVRPAPAQAAPSGTVQPVRRRIFLGGGIWEVYPPSDPVLQRRQEHTGEPEEAEEEDEDELPLGQVQGRLRARTEQQLKRMQEAFAEEGGGAEEAAEAAPSGRRATRGDGARPTKRPRVELRREELSPPPADYVPREGIELPLTTPGVTPTFPCPLTTLVPYKGPAATRGTYMKEFLVRVETRFTSLGLAYRPRRPRDPRPPFPTKSPATRSKWGETVLGDRWASRHLFWPFCTATGTDPFSEVGPYPNGVEEWLANNFPVDVVVELEYMVLPQEGTRARSLAPSRHYAADNALHKANYCWRYLFDNYPWLLPPALGRAPFWNQRDPTMRAVPLPPAE